MNIEKEFLKKVNQQPKPPQKKKLTLSIREDIIKEAKSKGIKISAALERLLIYLIHVREEGIPTELLRDNDKTGEVEGND